MRISDWSSDVCSSDLADVVRALAHNIAVKLPLTMDGLKACKRLTDDGTLVNVTLCFSANQALLAAKAGASFISPFVGRHDDRSEERRVGQDGVSTGRSRWARTHSKTNRKKEKT